MELAMYRSLFLTLLVVAAAADPDQGVRQVQRRGWTGCLVPAAVDSRATHVGVTGQVNFNGFQPAPTLKRVGDETPSLTGILYVGLEFAEGEEKAAAADCAALVNDPKRTVTGLRLLQPEGASELPLAVTPSPVTVQVAAGFVDLATVQISDAAVVLHSLEEEPLQAEGEVSFRGVLVTGVVGGTGTVISTLIPPMQESVPPGSRPIESASETSVIVNRVFSEQTVTLEVAIANYTVSYSFGTTDGLGADVTVSGRLLARSLIPTASNGCPSGLTGSSCSICSSDAGCHNPRDQCDTSFIFSADTRKKGFTCTSDDPIMSALMSDLELKCTPSGSPLPLLLSTLPQADPGAGFCEIEIAVNMGDSPAQLGCLAYNCDIPVGSSSAACSHLSCSCPDGCQGLDALAAGLSNATLECGASGKCKIAIAGLPMDSLPLTCTSGECMAFAGIAKAPSASPAFVPVHLSSAVESASALPPSYAVRSSEAGGDVEGACVFPWAINPSTKACECSPGMSGSTCEVCSSDSACVVDGAMCDNSLVYSESTKKKSLTCTSDDPTISQVVSSMDMQCNTYGTMPPVLQGVPDVDPSSSFCDVQVSLSLGSNPVDIFCSAYNCGIPVSSSSVMCTGVKCDCGAGGCQGMDKLVENLEGAGVDCDPTGSCTINIKGLPISSIPVNCTAGECQMPGQGTNFTGSDVGGEETDWLRIGLAMVGFLPTVVLLLLLLFVVLLAKGVTKAYSGKISPATLRRGRAKVLSFANLSVTVPQKEQQVVPVELAVSPQRRDTGAPPSTDDLVGGVESQTIRSSSHSRQHLSEEASRAKEDEASGWNLESGRRRILSGVSCEARCGEVVAIMGPSGSGKTTLLSILAAREGDLGNGALVEGTVLVDGVKRKARSFRSSCAFVAQDDTLFPSLTVKEAVSYSARLRLPGFSGNALEALVSKTLEELRLSHVTDVKIGTPGAGGGGRGVSGGERRRVSIAMEMVIQPSVIMLDEPTSGLDSFAASALMGSLREIAEGGRVVILTLHQPSPAAFLQLDKVLLLTGGRKVFDIAPDQVETYFDAAGYPCPRTMPIADHMLHVVSDPLACNSVLHQAAMSSPKLSSPLPVGGEVGNNQEAAEALGDDDDAPTAGSRWLASARRALMELDVLLWRGFVNLIRNPALFSMHSVVALAMGVGMGMVFLGVDDSLAGLQNKAGGIFFTLAFFAFCSLTTVDSFLAERSIVLRETQSGYYSAASYLLVKVMLDSLLLRVLPAILFSIPFYYLMGLNPSPERVLVWFAVLTTFSATAGALSMAATVGCPTAGTANLVMTLLLLTSLVFGGFLANLQVMPAWISWISYLSIFRYAFEALVVNEVVGSSFNLDVGGYQLDGLDNQLLLDVLGLNKDSFAVDVIVLDVLFVGFLVLSTIILYMILPKHTRRRRSSCAPQCFPSTSKGGSPQTGLEDVSDDSIEMSPV
mmetsp:Transcript_4254/g.11994  ORF Transcript_4254/g.11994 Transcript_4254/m.11994 type:complete len:1451 (+) Transcript_4254:158-4510(+)|eukprot:CAMPEP_0117652270 /NCGR_PEP_ID=MMETSP0804-20121206/2538_1 /TAXON_ID=1074897 /ORGANISM="Tetraselmis astigmatica, Strain CCMP880" /LENGTH=1450 /DNA_ID=CAMNT_0005458307 /DNA_START=82 /DNA_END=4434 /DNA_ORIENTATION=+